MVENEFCDTFSWIKDRHIMWFKVVRVKLRDWQGSLRTRTIILLNCMFLIQQLD